MNQALIPTLVRVRETEGHSPAQELLSAAMAWMCLLLAAGSVAMAAGARVLFPLLAGYLPAAKLMLTERLFYGLLPMVLLAGIASNCTAVLNTFERFAWPALAPIVTPLVMMLGAWLLARSAGRLGAGVRQCGRRAGECAADDLDDADAWISLRTVQPCGSALA